MKVAVEDLVIDGELDGTMQGYEGPGEGHGAPFALFSPDLQVNVGGPYASAEDAERALEVIKAGKMVPYTHGKNVTWTVNGKPSPWYEKD